MEHFRIYDRVRDVESKTVAVSGAFFFFRSSINSALILRRVFTIHEAVVAKNRGAHQSNCTTIAQTRADFLT